jgi:polyhydroxyalkanoate synthase
MSKVRAVDFLDEAQADIVDREFRALLARLTNGVSPLALSLATLDWISHLAISPGKQLFLVQSFLAKLTDLNVFAFESLYVDATEGPSDTIERRMSGPAWQKWPFRVFAQVHQSAREFTRHAVFTVEGVQDEHKEIVHAAAERVLEILSPANYPATNPEVLEALVQERGKNLARGLRFAVQDLAMKISNGKVMDNKFLNKRLTKPDGFKVGKNLATTAGKVVFRNALMELIQYSPATEKVGAEPVLISPAWIMKYYILDLSPHNSLVKYLTEQGKTVFIISWKNPGVEDKWIGFDDYIQSGLMEAINVVSAICPKRNIHGVGYCIGGTLLAVTAAAMARDDDHRLQTVSLFAAQTDFTEAGEISRFVGQSQLSFLDKLMWKQGYLPSDSMGSAFSSLRASDLIYGARVDRYLLGKETVPNDLMSWNADGTRMPHRMHAEYLQKLYLDNQLARNQLEVDGRAVAMSDIRVPMFTLGTETDHVAPWKSVFKIHQLTQCELTFVLTSGGHNAGVISGAKHPRRRHRVHTRIPGDKFISPDAWMESTPVVEGSWWPNWNQWLDQHMSTTIDPPSVGAPRKGYQTLGDAPGEYVYG